MFAIKAGVVVLLCLSVFALAEPEVEVEAADGADVDVQDEEAAESEDAEDAEEPEEPEDLTGASLSSKRTDIYTEITVAGDCSAVTGAKAAKGDMLTIEYSLYLPPKHEGANWKTDGQKIGGTETDKRGGARPIIMTLGSKTLLMSGVDDGIEGMCLGEDRDMIIPVAEGYGDADFARVNAQLVQQVQARYGELPVAVLNVKLHDVLAKGSFQYYYFWTTTYANQYGGQSLIGLFVLVLFALIYKFATMSTPGTVKKQRLGKKGKKRA